MSPSSERFEDSCQETDTDSHIRRHSVMNGLEQQHVDEKTADDRGYSVIDPDKDSNKGTR